ncbi:MAG: aspartate aminotransferase family protein [Culicoidibacterales bacterium]
MYAKLEKEDKAFLMNNYNRFPIALKTGEGSYCTAVSGQKYLDFTSGIGVNSLGHCYAPWVSAISRQAQTIGHTSNLYYTEPQITLARKLCDYTGCSKVFFANSGSEANEAALKAARKYGKSRKGEQAIEIIALKSAFHGRTMGSLSMTPQKAYTEAFTPLLTGISFVEANNFPALVAKITPQTCAIILELIQGEGGLNDLTDTYVKAIWQTCQDKDILLIIDEVQTGCGRTGTFYAYEQYDIIPDIVTLAKGLGGGLPIGATLFYDKCRAIFAYGDHGTTFGGGAIVAAGANIVFDTITAPSFLPEVQDKSAYMRQQIRKMPLVVSLSGKGLMIGIELAEHILVSEAVKRANSQGLLTLTAKNKWRLLPALNISKAEIDEGLKIMKKVLTDLEKEG